MTIECTIRFEDKATAQRFLETILTSAEAETLNGLIGGFYFHTERSALQVLTNIESEGFDPADFSSIEFRF